MTIEIADTVLTIPIGNMIGNVVVFKSMDFAVGNKVVLFPCAIATKSEYIVACKALSTDSLCSLVSGNKAIVVPIRGNKDYVVALCMPGEELELQFTEPWEDICAEPPLQFTEGWNFLCASPPLKHEEGWNS